MLQLYLKMIKVLLKTHNKMSKKKTQSYLTDKWNSSTINILKYWLRTPTNLRQLKTSQTALYAWQRGLLLNMCTFFVPFISAVHEEVETVHSACLMSCANPL